MKKYLIIVLFFSIWSCEDTKENDETPPSVIITSPQNNTTVYGEVNFIFMANDNVAIDKIELWINGLYTGLLSNSEPYLINWNSSMSEDGSYTIIARAYDTSQNVKDSNPIVINVDNSILDCAGVAYGQNICGCTDSTAINFNSYATFDDSSCEYDTTPPNIQIQGPNTDNHVYGSILIDAIVSDNVGIDYVEFYIDDQVVYTDSFEPYSFNWNTTVHPDSSIHPIKAIAYDYSGNSTESSTISYVIDNSDIVFSHDICADSEGFYFNTIDGNEVESFQVWHISIQRNDETNGFPSLILGEMSLAIYEDINYDSLNSLPETFVDDVIDDNNSVGWGQENEVFGYDNQSHVMVLNKPENVYVFYEPDWHNVYKVKFLGPIGCVFGFKYEKLQ